MAPCGLSTPLQPQTRRESPACCALRRNLPHLNTRRYFLSLLLIIGAIWVMKSPYASWTRLTSSTHTLSTYRVVTHPFAMWMTHVPVLYGVFPHIVNTCREKVTLASARGVGPGLLRR